MKTKLLIVDDSRIFRSAVEECLTAEEDIEVIGSVWNGEKAIEFIRSNPPDLVTLDIEMPGMNGLETLKAIQKINASGHPSKPIGVIMLSSHTQKGADITVRALEMGAFDFIPKPEGKSLKESIEILHHQLAVKIRNFASKSISSRLKKPQILIPTPARPASETPVSSRIKAILVGVSTGGPKALAEILPPMCERVDVPILIVQHMPPTFTESLARSLNAKCRYTVMEGVHDDIVREKYVYIAPGGQHMLLMKKRQTVRTILNDQPPEKGCKPSVDILFRSSAAVYGSSTIAVILTGMG
ncbi:MAG: chemotaxis-specific protein-glutamate methyltransferase CheB, partial [Deltaproteobacteria bacterium]|nr:chemotaxis-specific protein-glutamate methyltransferase CheB [Deltaproteobacteria bacterium]